MLSGLDEIAAGFSLLCLAYVLRREEPGLNEGTDPCHRLSVNAQGQRWTHTHTQTHMHAQPLVCFSAVKGSHSGLNFFENVSLVLCFQDVSGVRGTTCTQVLHLMLDCSPTASRCLFQSVQPLI